MNRFEQTMGLIIAGNIEEARRLLENLLAQPDALASGSNQQFVLSLAALNGVLLDAESANTLLTLAARMSLGSGAAVQEQDPVLTKPRVIGTALEQPGRNLDSIFDASPQMSADDTANNVPNLGHRTIWRDFEMPDGRRIHGGMAPMRDHYQDSKRPLAEILGQGLTRHGCFGGQGIPWRVASQESQTPLILAAALQEIYKSPLKHGTSA